MAIIPIYFLALLFLKQAFNLVVYLQVCGFVHIIWGSTAWDRSKFITFYIVTLIFIQIHVHLQMRQNELFFCFFALLIFVPSDFFGSKDLLRNLFLPILVISWSYFRAERKCFLKVLDACVHNNSIGVLRRLPQFNLRFSKSQKPLEIIRIDTDGLLSIFEH